MGVPDVYTEVGKITCSPNPVNGLLYISAAEPITSVVVSNLLGQVVIEVAGFKQEKDATVSFATLPAGMYFVMVNNRYVRRVVREL